MYTQTQNKIFDMVRAVTEKNQKRALDLIDSGRLDVSSMVAQVCGLEKLEEILANPEARAKGKYIISPEM